MSLQPASFACDVCEKRRDNDVNHWYILEAGMTLEIWKWDEIVSGYSGMGHACGQACACVLVARWMSHGDFTDGVKGTKSENMLAGRERM